MSELSDSNPLPDNELADEQEARGSGSMLFTMLLMSAGFVFAGVLLMQKSLEAKAPDGQPVVVLSQILEAGKALANPPPTEEAPEGGSDADHASPLDSIKQIVNIQPSDRVKWPRVKMTGFGKSTDGTESFAIINGDLVHPGEYTDKIRLVEVREHDVVVEYRDEQRTLTVELQD